MYTHSFSMKAPVSVYNIQQFSVCVLCECVIKQERKTEMGTESEREKERERERERERVGENRDQIQFPSLCCFFSSTVFSFCCLLCPPHHITVFFSLSLSLFYLSLSLPRSLSLFICP